MNYSPISRRHMVAALGLSLLAGCTDAVSLKSDSETGIPLGSLFVHNPSEESQSVQLQLKRANEIVYEGTVEAAEGYEIIDPSWSTEPAEYTLLYATDESIGSASIPADFEGKVDSADCYHALFNFHGPLEPQVELWDSDEFDEGAC
ncbi:hypothetical protein [Natrinema sp. DC36]|uniref:hypothetical protein n=1 Tax=Natrinema sp. DC36 TaxID=2878680 RepID=UPI001CEFB27E|nr:hypothetical protein [Natrinema sp. DC36]